MTYQNSVSAAFTADLNYEYITDTAHIERVRSDLLQHNRIEFDTETTGLSFIDNRILLFQMGTPDKQYVVDARRVPIHAFQDILESPNIAKYIHNAAFDYKMVKATGITMERIIDTQLMECVLTAGLMKSGRDLESCMKRYFNYELDKTLQDSFTRMNEDSTFSEAQLQYAALDVAVLRKLSKKQFKTAQKEGLLQTMELECAAVPAFGDMEFYGMCLDSQMWLGNLSHSVADLKGTIQELNTLVQRYNLVDQDLEGQLFFSVEDKKKPRKYNKVYLNWASQPCLKYILKQLFTKEVIESTDDEALVYLYDKYNKHPLIKLIQDYRGLAKKTGTYGVTYTEHVHPKTGMFHASFNQYGTDTGRPTGKKPNMLNIPRDKYYRHAFRAPSGYDWHTSDYSGCELRIIASMSKDPEMCKAFNEGKDLHTYVAAKFMDLDYEELNAKVEAKDPAAKETRQAAKGLNFGIIYGLGPGQLATDLKIPLQKAREYYYSYRKQFRVMCDYLEKLSESAVVDGYSTTVLGRKRYFRKPAYPKAILDDWNARRGVLQGDTIFTFAKRKMPNYRQFKEDFIFREGTEVETPTFGSWVKGEEGKSNLTPEQVRFFRESSAIQRQAGNHPVQGGNADITKHAMVNIRKRFKERGFYPEAHIVLQVYDEICITAPTKWREEVAHIMKEEMIKAGQMVIKDIPVLVDSHCEQTWTK